MPELKHKEQKVMHPYKLLGFFFVGLGFVGIFLPLLPTVPFLLLAAGCFSKSSKKWHKWLLNNPTFGPIIHQWEENRCIPPRAKATAMTMITAFGGTSIWVIDLYWLKISGLLLVLYALYFLYSIKTCSCSSKK